MKMKFEFEHIDDHHSRAKVPGGWLVKVEEGVTHYTPERVMEGSDWRPAIAFVPDPKHEWIIDYETDE